MARINVPFLKRAGLIGIIAASTLALSAPAQATQFDAKQVTCTSSTGYFVQIKGKAKGYVTHSVDYGSRVWDKGLYTSATTLWTKTSYSGTHYAEVQGIDRPGIVGSVSSNTSGCTT